jgi:hypothetical protein
MLLEKANIDMVQCPKTAIVLRNTEENNSDGDWIANMTFDEIKKALSG